MSDFVFLPQFDRLCSGNMTLNIIEKKESGRVNLPYYYYEILVDGAPVGKISIRIGDSFHTYYNGHIGYEVDEGARGHGYARRACGLVLDVARAHGMSRIYITCAQDNIPSYRTIEKLGGRLLEICEVPREYFAWYEGIPRHRVYQLNLYQEGDGRMDIRKKLHSGELYYPNDPAIMAEQLQYLDRLYDFNQTRPLEQEKRAAMLKEMFAEIGEGCYIEPPFHSNMGGRHIHFGKFIYVNFNGTFVDDTHIYVGDYTMFGPNVVIATAGHPILPELREKGLQYNAPVRIGRNCWLGAGVIVVPGVTIGDNVVVGAGSVVTKDLPSNVVAAGNPCKILREVNEHDREYYFKERKIHWDELS